MNFSNNNDELVTKFDWKRSIINTDYKEMFNTDPPFYYINILGFIIFVIIYHYVIFMIYNCMIFNKDFTYVK